MPDPRTVLLVVLGATACATPAAPTRPVDHRAPDVAGCLPSAVRDAPIHGSVTTLGDRARVCYGPYDAPSCVLVDTSGRITGAVPAPPEPTGPEPGKYTLAATEQPDTASVCLTGTTRCSRLAAGFPVEDALHEAAVSDDGKRVFLFHYEPTPPALVAVEGEHEIWGDIFDLATSTRTSHVKLTRLCDGCYFSDWTQFHTAAFTGPRDVVVGQFPAGPGGEVMLVNPARGRGVPLHGYGGSRLDVDARTLLVADGRQVFTVDLDSLDVTSSFAIPGASTVDDPEFNAADLGKAGTSYFVAYTRPAGVMLVDPVNHQVSPAQPFRLCP